MENFIDIGIDFGAENIVVVAIGYDNKGRIDYKLVNLHSSGSIKNYIAEKKSDKKIEIGNEVKISYIYHDSGDEFNWIYGRYKAFIAEEPPPGFLVAPDLLLKYGLEEIIAKLEKFDFKPLLSGTLRNLTVGIPQSWGFNKKLIYRDILSIWQHGSVSLLSEPVAATIAAFKRSSADIGKNIIMILDIGASTFDISFARYHEDHKNLDIFSTTYRSEWAGHYFDLVFAAFCLQADINKLPANEIMDRLAKLKLKDSSDYIAFLQKNQEKYSTLLLELETVKENHLLEIVKFNRKKLIDVGTRTPITVTKQIYIDALNFYAAIISADINQLIEGFKKAEKISETEKIYPFLCGGASSLNGLEKSLKDKISGGESDRLFSILKEGHGNRIDTTIAVGLAYYSQDKSIIGKKLEYSVGVGLSGDEDADRAEFWLLNEGDRYPFQFDKKLSELLGEDKELQYHGNGDGSIGFPVLQKSGIDSEQVHSDIIELSLEDCNIGDNFDLLFNVDIDGIITVMVENLTKAVFTKKSVSLRNLTLPGSP